MKRKHLTPKRHNKTWFNNRKQFTRLRQILRKRQRLLWTVHWQMIQAPAEPGV